MPRTTSQVQKTFGRKIRKLRKAQGLTQEKLAEHLRISTVYVGYIEQGKGKPSFKLLMKMARRLGVKVEDLFQR